MSESFVGRRIVISPKVNYPWRGTYTVIKHLQYGMVIINHPILGDGGFFTSEFELIPLSKLEKALK